MVPASLSAGGAGGSVYCETPSQPEGAHGLSVSPNAQQFSAPSDFAYFAPPVLSTSSPSTGPSAGGTVVVVHGAGIAPAVSGGSCDTVCRFGDLLVPGPSAGTVALFPSGEVDLYGGAGTLAGTADSIASTVTCVSPANPAAEGANLDLLASPNRVVRRRHITAGDVPIGTETCQLARSASWAPAAGCVSACARTRTSELRSGASRAACLYSDAQHPPSARAGRSYSGRRALLTRVRYGTRLLKAVPAPSGSLRSSSFVPVTVEYGPSGLVVTHAGVTYADGLPVAEWAPTRGWRFAIGARAGSDADDHHVDDVVVEAGSAFVPTTVPLSISLNGLQYSEELGWEYGVETADQAEGLEADEF